MLSIELMEVQSTYRVIVSGKEYNLKVVRIPMDESTEVVEVFVYDVYGDKVALEKLPELKNILSTLRSAK